jgi:hypothetical protein
LPAEFLLVLATSLNASNEDLLTLSALDMIHVCMYVCMCFMKNIQRRQTLANLHLMSLSRNYVCVV